MTTEFIKKRIIEQRIHILEISESKMNYKRKQEVMPSAVAQLEYFENKLNGPQPRKTEEG